MHFDAHDYLDAVRLQLVTASFLARSLRTRCRTRWVLMCLQVDGDVAADTNDSGARAQRLVLLTDVRDLCFPGPWRTLKTTCGGVWLALLRT